MSKKAESWFQTYTGKVFNIGDPDPESICILDIAHGLALQCRYNGATRKFYSIAQHSLEVLSEVWFQVAEGMALHEMVPALRDVLKLALMHDASEAYLGDVISPLKSKIPEYVTIEDSVLRVILDKFGLQGKHPDDYAVIRQADLYMLVVERQNLHRRVPPQPWFVDTLPPSKVYGKRLLAGNKPPSLPLLVPWSAEYAESRFLETFHMLFEK